MRVCCAHCTGLAAALLLAALAAGCGMKGDLYLPEPPAEPAGPLEAPDPATAEPSEPADAPAPDGGPD
jgi:predicted small lipoprotein YifL